MRALILAAGSLALLAAAQPAAADSCDAQIHQAQRFVDQLRPGPNTRAAERYIEAARRAPSERQCFADLRAADRYARRSAELDRGGYRYRYGYGYGSSAPPVQCADIFHQDRPGGSDYHGPPVPGCQIHR